MTDGADMEERKPHMTTNFWGRLLLAGVAGGAGLVFASCTVVHNETASTKSLFQSLTGQFEQAKTTNLVEQVQSGVMREADLYVAMLAQATDEFRVRVPTPAARDAAQQWKLLEATGAYINATGENPIMNAVDMVVLATLSRYVVEDNWVGEKFGESARPLLEVHRQLESNSWAVVQQVLTTNQQAEVRNLLAAYRQRYPSLHYVMAVRFREMIGHLGQIPTSSERTKPGSLFSLLYLNPLAGLDPTTQAIQQTRILAQRAMYYAQRTPTLLAWQVELTCYQLAAQPEARDAIAAVDAVGQSSKVFAKTAAELPKLVNDQREAAIKQLLDGLATERTNIIAALSAQENKLSELVPQVRQTLIAGNDMANSVNTTIQSLHAFVRSASPPPTTTAAQTPDTNSPPFNVLDYGKAASQIGAAAVDLNTLLTTANQSLPQVTRLSQQAALDANAVVNHAFWLGVVLIVIAGIVATLVVVICRRCHTRPPP